MSDWLRQYECQFWDRETGLRELAFAYLKETEDYDQMVCAHRTGRFAIPITPEERRLCTSFAESKRAYYTEWAERAGMLGETTFWAAVKKAEREFEATYRFTLTPEIKSTKLL